ncbi:hypothetical protein PAPYR_10057 [Paratrimastix pyriformis]|uniref:Uncharacterized protein n=1 Tax=Paratrimastix pyriformis TaxID=342808 RepID=A0ABQ8U6W5_9EUKA|nr:hypothetical protein PAPYR_10057 [Paratrimastix pyriformis]
MREKFRHGFKGFPVAQDQIGRSFDWVANPTHQCSVRWRSCTFYPGWNLAGVVSVGIRLGLHVELCQIISPATSGTVKLSSATCSVRFGSFFLSLSPGLGRCAPAHTEIAQWVERGRTRRQISPVEASPESLPDIKSQAFPLRFFSGWTQDLSGAEIETVELGLRQGPIRRLGVSASLPGTSYWRRPHCIHQRWGVSGTQVAILLSHLPPPNATHRIYAVAVA